MLQTNNTHSNLIDNEKLESESLISLFENSVRTYGNKTAIFHNDEAISYYELNCQANIIANRLFELGVKEGDIIAILIERNINLIASILGVLKAGVAYVIIDPEYPTNRIEYILNDTCSKILLIESLNRDNLKFNDIFNSYKGECIYIAELLENIIYKDSPILKSHGDSLACVIYTSGSTGKPKGALLPHKAFFRLFNGPNMVQTSHEDCIAQISSATFDLSIYDIWAALGKGSSLVIIDKYTALSPEDLENCFKKYQITTALFPTSLFHQLVRAEPSIFKSLKNVLLCGEAANLEIIRQIVDCKEFRPHRIFNLYGPVESAVFATCYEIKALDDSFTTIPIGLPINDTQVYLLNDDLKKVQVGEIGELYLGGKGVAKGYLNLPELTAEKFIINPFTETDLIYKTGDLAKILPNGMIEFIGRKDNQVKIRGFRIELNEIEYAIESYPNIWKSVVIAPYIYDGHRQLIAYFTSKNNENTIEASDVKLHLKQILPEYMIPNIIIQLDSLPLNSHGKIDRQVLLNDCLKRQVKKGLE